ncbi:shikimate kinase [Rhizobiaceae sp. 2RAB30]
MTTEHISMEQRPDEVLQRLGSRSIVFVGLMGAGKTAIGRRVASALGLSFTDSDHEIETVSRMTVPELFERYGEAEFRALEQRVIARILESGPQVLSTGGGAYMNEHTREAIAERAVSVWLKADIDTLMDRVSKKQNRPLLKNPDPRAVMQRLMAERYPVYARADVTVPTRDERKEVIAAEVITALFTALDGEAQARPDIARELP